jgi:hypothetical protein
MRTYFPFHTRSIAPSGTVGAVLAKERFIGFDGALCGLGKKAFGVSDADTEVPKAGENNMMPVVVSGEVNVLVGATISWTGSDFYAKVTSDANGQAIPQGTGQELNGYAIRPNSATTSVNAGSYVLVRLVY